MSATVASKQHHLLIGGTGRAGTSFLVRYFTEAGLDTTLARQGGQAFWDNQANAGLEEMPVDGDPGSVPYVIKTPWLYQIVERLAADPARQIDGVIIPVRSLHEAAASRVIVEMRNMYASAPWMAELDEPFSVWGTTAGGCLLQLEPIDQARLLATGFHQLIERLVQFDVPITFLAFPRLAEDPDYLFEKLAPFLPGIGLEQARGLHASVADNAMIRVGDELGGPSHPAGPVSLTHDPDPKLLQNAALRRELTLCRSRLAAAETHAAASGARAEMLQTEAAAAATDVSAAEDRAREARAEKTHVQQRMAELEATAESLRRTAEELRFSLAAASGAVARERERSALLAADLAKAENVRVRACDRADTLARLGAEQQALVTATHASTSWRLTRPLRDATTGMRRLKAAFVRQSPGN